MILEQENKVYRHTVMVRIIHWAVAASIFALYFSGFGQMPIYKRYMLTDVPNFAWTGDYWLTLKIHYIAALILTTAAAWHFAYHVVRRDFGLMPRRGDMLEAAKIMAALITGRPEPPADKYLAEQRLAYLFTAAMTFILIVTGIIKVLKNHVYINDSLHFYSTHVHNAAAMFLLFGIIAHLAAFLVPINRKLLPSMISGKVDLDYVKHRHSKWYERLKKQKK